MLGIDLGTSQLKALVATPDGRVLGRGRAGYPVTVPAEGRAETDPEDWWRAAKAAVRDALADAGRVDVTGLALAGQMHGVVLADSAGTPRHPAILWLDRRAVAEADAYRRLPARLTAPLGNQPSPGMAGPILCWLARHEPRPMQRARWVMQPKDWLRMRLTGEPATDPTDASGTLLFDSRRGAWADDLIDALGLPREKFPGIREPTEIAGRLLNDAADELGLPPGIPVAVGAADTAAALYSVFYWEEVGVTERAGTAEEVGVTERAGTEEEGAEEAETEEGETEEGETEEVAAGSGSGRASDALLTLGTGGQWIVPESGFRPTENTNLFRAIGTGYYRLAAAQNVGATLDWVKTVLGASWQDLYATAARPWREDVPVFLPYLTAERWDTAAAPKGTWTGLTLAHNRDDLLRAALEGVAFLLNDRLEDLRAAGDRPARVIIGGGGTRHPAWRQLLADVLGLPLRPAPTTWLSAAGAALIAAEATGEPAATATQPVTGGERKGVSRVRSEYGKEGKAEAVAPGERRAAAARYDRFLFTRRSWPTS